MSISNFNGFYTRLPNEAKCHICKRIFCCGKCRQKHEFVNHAIAVSEPLDMTAQQEVGPAPARTIYIFCPICQRKPLVLRDEALYPELLQHIEEEHLPLRCRKCLKNYAKIEDLRAFSKCFDQEQNCSTSSCSTEEASKVTVKKAAASSTISTQTSPAMTPISLINLHWKAKSRQQQQHPATLQEEFICGGDSVSSIRNLSSFSSSNFSLRRSISQFPNPYANPPETAKKGKVIRSTSTPLQVDSSMFPKNKETVTFNASSLYHEELPSPAMIETNPLQHRAWKGGAGSAAAVARNKVAAVTPLRQVMSKSIQKAFVEHGGLMTAATSTALAPPPLGGRLRFDLSDNNSSASSSPALDLRLSPALRRTQAEAPSTARTTDSSNPIKSTEHSSSSAVLRQQVLMSAQKLTTESIIITRNSHEGANGCSTVYNSCESVEIIQTTSHTAEIHKHLHHPPPTPITRIPGAMINKKLIKFETPQKQTKDSPTDDINDPNNRSSKDMFYTPNADTPNNKSPESSNQRVHIIPRQLSDQFSPRALPALEQQLPPDRPRRRPPLRNCQTYKAFTDTAHMPPDLTNCDATDEEDEEVFTPTNASTRNDKTSDQGIGRLWSLMSTVMRLPASREKGDKENQNPNQNPLPTGGSLLRRCASIAGSFVRSRAEGDNVGDMQTLKRKRTQTLDNNHLYGSGSATNSPLSPLSGTSSKRYRIQPRRPIERMRRQT